MAAGVLVVLAGCGHSAGRAAGSPLPDPATPSASPASGELVTGTGYTFRLPAGWPPDRSPVSVVGAGTGSIPDLTVTGPPKPGVVTDILTVTLELWTTDDEHASDPSPGLVDGLVLHSDDPFVLDGLAARALTFSYSVGAQRLVSRQITCVHDEVRLTVGFTTDGLDAGPGLHAFDEILASWSWIPERRS